MERIVAALVFVAFLIPAMAFAADGPYSVQESSDSGVFYVVNKEGKQQGKAHTTEDSAERAANKMNREHKKREKEEANR